MQEKTVWFGTEDDLVQVKCPSTELTRTRVAWRNSGTYLNGGGFALSSGTAHEEASISWGADSVDGFATLMTQLNKGEPLYYLDPLACKTNILPPYAAQYQPNNPFGFVAESATGVNGYPSTALKNLYVDRQIATIPVPEGYRLWVGCAGSSGGVSVDAPPPEWVEVGRNLAVRPYSTASNNTQDARVLASMAGWGAGNAAPAYTIVPDEDTATGFATAGVAVADGKMNPGGDLLVCNLHIPATVGETYSTRMRIKATFDVDIRLQFQLLNATNGAIWDIKGTVTPLKAGEWTEVSLEGATIPAGDTTKVRIDIDAGSAAQFTAEDKIMLDTLSFQQGDTAVLFSGDHAPDGMRSEWLGEPNNSASVLYEHDGRDDPEIPAEPPNSSQRLTHHYPGGRSYSLFVQGGSVLQGVMAQILPEGQTPSSGGFIPGMGFSALALQDNPQITEYSAVLENYQMAMTANFIEVGSWM